MLSREDKKGQTRRALMDAALRLVEQGNNFASISLREVAKNAGVVPTSFYRHFRDMEELGLNVIDDLGLMLRKLLRSARQGSTAGDDPTRTSLAVLVEFIGQNKPHFYFLSQVKGGGTPALRNAIRNELGHFAQELSSDLRTRRSLEHLSPHELTQGARLVVSTVNDSIIDLLDLSETHPDFRQEFIEQMVWQLEVIWAGLARQSAPKS